MIFKFLLDDKTHEVTLPYELSAEVKQAKRDYDTSFKFIITQNYYIWKYAYKSYHLSTLDRKTWANLKTWQSNIHSGFIRSFIDVFTSSLSEKPLTFFGSAYNEEGLANKDNILHALTAIADKSKFHTEMRSGLEEGLKTGTFAYRIGYKKQGNTVTIPTIVDKLVIDKTIETEPADYPYAKSIDVFKIFPDPQNTGELRYVTERNVTSYSEFMETWVNLIKSPENKSPLKSKDFLKALANPKNTNSADFKDFGDIRDQIYQKINNELRKTDSYERAFWQMNFASYASTNETANDDSEVTRGMIEWKYYTRKDTIVLFANNYPVFIWPNKKGFINYIIKPATSSRVRMGCEGIPYLLRGFEEAVNSFLNNMIDSGRAIATPTFTVIKGLLVNEYQLENAPPGWLVHLERSEFGHDVVRRMEKGSTSDFGIIQTLQQLAQSLTGVSEYNMGQASGERTASGANALTTSASKRLSPYVSNFMQVLVGVGEMWLKLITKQWLLPQYVSVLDEEAGIEVQKYLTNASISGGLTLSLSPEGLFTNFNDMKFKRLMDLYVQVSQSGIVDSPQIIGELFKAIGLPPTKFVTDYGKKKPDAPQWPIPTESGTTATPNTSVSPEQDISKLLAQSNSPQPDFGNAWQGQP